MALLSRTAAEEVIASFTSEEQSRISTQAVLTLTNVEKDKHDLFNYALPELAKMKLFNSGIYLSPHSYRPHSHPVCKTLENNVLFNILPSYLDNSFYLVSIKKNKVDFLKRRHPDLQMVETINRYVSSLDKLRYGNFFHVSPSKISTKFKCDRRTGFETDASLVDLIPGCMEGARKKFFFHDELHYWKKEALITFLDHVKPEIMLASIVYPPEILAGAKESLNPWCYTFKIIEKDLVFFPDGEESEAYIQPLSGAYLLKTSRIVTPSGDVFQLDLLKSSFSHHLISITKGDAIGQKMRFFNGFEAVAMKGLNPLRRKVESCLPVSKSMILKIYRYLRTLKKPDLQSAMAKLSQVCKDPNGYEIKFFEEFSKLCLRCETLNTNMLPEMRKIVQGFFLKLFPNPIARNFKVVQQLHLDNFIETLEDFSFSINTEVLTLSWKDDLEFVNLTFADTDFNLEDSFESTWGLRKDFVNITTVHHSPYSMTKFEAYEFQFHSLLCVDSTVALTRIARIVVSLYSTSLVESYDCAKVSSLASEVIVAADLRACFTVVDLWKTFKKILLKESNRAKGKMRKTYFFEVGAKWFFLNGSKNVKFLPSGKDGFSSRSLKFDQFIKECQAEVSNQTVVSEANNRADVNSVETMKSHSQLVAVEIGSSEGPQNHASGSGCIKEQGVDADVNMEEGISEQEGDMIVECGTSTPVIPSASGSDIHNLIEDTSMQPVQEENILMSSISDFLIEESACKSAEKGPSCAASDPPGSMPGCLSVADECIGSSNGLVNCVSPCLSIVPCDAPQVLKSPTPSVSPRVNASRKSLRTSSMLTASQKDLTGRSTLSPDGMRISMAKPAIKSSANDLSAQTCNNFSAPAEQLAASIRHGLEIIGSHRQSSALRKSSFRFSLKPSESRVIVPVSKADVGVQTSQEIVKDNSVEFMCSNCKNRMQLDVEGNEIMQLVPVDGSESADKSKIQVPKAVEKVLAGAIRREMALEDICAKKTSEIMQLNRLVQQYKHERECNGIIAQTREDKILRLESLMDGVLPTEEFMEEELVSLTHEYKLLKEKYENHPELLRTNIELKRVQDELENLRNFCDMGEREVLLEEIQDLRSQLQFYVDCSSTSARTRNSMMKLTHSRDPNMVPLSTISESNEESSEQKLEQERQQWNEVESKWISLAEELRMELEASRSLAEKTMQELETEKKCADELKEAMQLAMEGQSRMLEQYADLEEKHMQLLARHRMIRDGVEDVKKAAAKAGVRGAESKFINAIASEISALRVERERERRYLRDENKGLQAQLRDTAEAVQAAGELLVRLKEADEAVATAQKQAMEAKQEADKAYIKIEKLKKKHEKEISSLNELIAESRLPKQATPPAYDGSNNAKYDAGEPHSLSDQRWREEFEPFYNGEEGELRKLTQPSSWFSGYDRCNI